MKELPNPSAIDSTSLSGLNHLGQFLKNTQLNSGAIPSNKNKSHDPWDHLEAVMGLSTLGFKLEAIKGLDWMALNQNDDGSWFNLYNDNDPLELNKQTNYASYIAVAVWHLYLLTKDKNILQKYWHPVKQGILFSLALQNNNGAIAWNIDESEKVDNDYLLTGCSSIAKSIECAIAISQVLEEKACEAAWKIAHSKLLIALESPAGIFDLKKDRSRFSMDWYYPLLAGVVSEERIKDLTTKINNSFWIRGLGIKCVEDEPWVTVAETSECSIAFKKIGETQIAEELLQNAISIVDEQSIPFMGWQFEENIYWPDEKPAWTSAACILAADAINNLTNASILFLKEQFKS